MGSHWTAPCGKRVLTLPPGRVSQFMGLRAIYHNPPTGWVDQDQSAANVLVRQLLRAEAVELELTAHGYALRLTPAGAELFREHGLPYSR